MIYDSLPDRPPTQRLWQGVIATTPTSFSQRVDVIIPAFDDTLRWQNCRWQARNSSDLPAKGNSCLAAIDDNDEVWVIAWWPF